RCDLRSRLRPRTGSALPSPPARHRPAVGSPALPGDSRPAVLRLERVTKTYRMGEVLVHALRGVDLALLRGELLVLLGPSGSGKSTLLNILGGLDVPTTGRVLFGAEELAAKDRDALTEFRRRHVGFVFQ